MKPEQMTMNIETYHKCFEICQKVKIARAGKVIRKWDYPAAIVSCADAWANYANAEIESSGKAACNSYHKTPKLETALKALGDIGSQSSICNNYIGACAEPRAARIVMEKNPAIQVANLVFSYAYRPRTKTVLRHCRNCVNIFNIQNP